VDGEDAIEQLPGTAGRTLTVTDVAGADPPVFEATTV
jgi:hypothetical protein